MSELKSRIEAKKKQLEADLLTLKADAQGKTSEAAKRIKAKLAELETLLAQGWGNLNDNVRAKLNDWLR